MAQLVKAAQAGFDEKNDALVTVEPIASGIEIELTSKLFANTATKLNPLS